MTKINHKTTLMTDCKPCFHPSYANGKLGGKSSGLMAIGYHPGKGQLTFNNGQLVSDCFGTCGAVDCKNCMKSCYAVKGSKRFLDSRKNRIENTMQLRTDINGHFKDIYNRILSDDIKVVRYTDSGEIESYLQFTKLVNLAFSLPFVRFYLYTKNYSVLREFFGENKELPKNMVVLISIWGNIGETEYKEFKDHRNIRAFAVNSNIKATAQCPAYTMTENGKIKLNKDVTCIKCGLCFGDYTATKVIKCLEH